jgi:hypothetical protein
MKHPLWSLAATLLALTPVQAQVSWQSHDGPWFARIDDFAAGVSAGQTAVYAADSIDAEQTSGAILFKSTDGGALWVRKYITGATGYANCVATFASDANIIYAGTSPYQGVFRSTDGGDT